MLRLKGMEARPVPESAASPWRSGGLRGVADYVEQEPGATGAPAVISLPKYLALRAANAETTPHEGAMADMTREELDAKLGKATAETDTKFAQLLGRIDSSNAEIKGEISTLSAHFAALERSTSGVKATIIATVAVGIAIVIAILGYGQQWFGIGMSTRDIVRQTVQEMQSPSPPPSTRK
jgi:hypothetical protein